MLAEIIIIIIKKKNQPPYCITSKVKRYSQSTESYDEIMCCMVRGTTNTGA